MQRNHPAPETRRFLNSGVIMLENNRKSISTLNDLDTARSPTASGSNGERSGRVKHDSRGNAVWDWEFAAGIFASIKSTELLSKLDNPALALEGDTCCTDTADWSGDPYNRR